ncbi:hypothetical protein C5N14_03595 [Micromonospora sp. MW-13]|nr:hypothetical protein C5N14_03595 [Micromonospora sp. MW-13]
MAALGLAAVLYASWLLGPLLNPALGPLTGYASELAARDQPYHLVFGLGDLSTGLLAAAAGTALTRRARGWPRAAWAGVALFGAATALDGGVATMDCSPSRDAACARLEELGEVSLRHQTHTVTSSVAVAAALFSLLAFLAATRGATGSRHRWALLVAGVLLVGTAGTLVEVARPGELLGLWQRVQLAGLSGWLLLAAGAAVPGPGAVTGRPAGRDGGDPGRGR